MKSYLHILTPIKTIWTPPFTLIWEKDFSFSAPTSSGKSNSSEQSPGVGARNTLRLSPTSNTFPSPFRQEEMKPKLHCTEVLSDRAKKSECSGSAQGRGRLMPRHIWHICLPELGSCLPLAMARSLKKAVNLKRKIKHHWEKLLKFSSYYSFKNWRASSPSLSCLQGWSNQAEFHSQGSFMCVCRPGRTHHMSHTEGEVGQITFTKGKN